MDCLAQRDEDHPHPKLPAGLTRSQGAQQPGGIQIFFTARSFFGHDQRVETQNSQLAKRHLVRDGMSQDLTPQTPPMTTNSTFCSMSRRNSALSFCGMMLPRFPESENHVQRALMGFKSLFRGSFQGLFD
jgi:hypothetical protein